MSTPFPVGVPDAEIPTHFGGDGWEEVCKALDAIKGWIKADKIERTVEDLRTPLKLIWPSLGAGSRGVVLNVLNRTRKAICGKSLVVNDIVDLLPTFVSILEAIKHEAGGREQTISLSRHVLEDALARVLEVTTNHSRKAFEDMVRAIRTSPILFQGWDKLSPTTQFEVVRKIWDRIQNHKYRWRRRDPRGPLPSINPLTPQQLLENTPDAFVEQKAPIEVRQPVKKTLRGRKKENRGKRHLPEEYKASVDTSSQVSCPLQFVPQAGRAQPCPHVLQTRPSPRSLRSAPAPHSQTARSPPAVPTHGSTSYQAQQPLDQTVASSSFATNFGFPDQLVSPAFQPDPAYLPLHPLSPWQHPSPWDLQSFQRPDPRGLVPYNPHLDNFPLDPTYAPTYDPTARTHPPTYDPTSDFTPPFYDPNQR